MFDVRGRCRRCARGQARQPQRVVKSGSADALEALGAVIELQPDQVAAAIERTGIGFMFAPIHHPSMKVVAPVRREMGVRTIFNILGPLTNPASAPSVLMGVFHPDLVGIQARVLRELGTERAMVVWGRDNMDEISLGAGTLVGELRDGKVREYEIHPEDFGIAMSASRNLRVDGPEQSIQMLRAVLDNEPGPALDIVALNAGAAACTLPAWPAISAMAWPVPVPPSPMAAPASACSSMWKPPARWLPERAVQPDPVDGPIMAVLTAPTEPKTMSDILQTILARKAEEVAQRRAQRPLEGFRRRGQRPAVRGFVRALQAAVANGDPAVIAEVKKASPSRV